MSGTDALTMVDGAQLASDVVRKCKESFIARLRHSLQSTVEDVLPDASEKSAGTVHSRSCVTDFAKRDGLQLILSAQHPFRHSPLPVSVTAFDDVDLARLDQKYMAGATSISWQRHVRRWRIAYG